jgi:ubiquitin-protein ligase
MQVESIVLSIISMLSSPNDESPANIEAAVSAPYNIPSLSLWVGKQTAVVFFVLLPVQRLKAVMY